MATNNEKISALVASFAGGAALNAESMADATELVRVQIIQQAGTAMLAQANHSQQAVVSLLR